uniref:Uncharacterized protein n=1 Tax=Kalanchoe fedtschenkoi TaxID=63787 RepID=A0A7N0REK0_KALFE
VNGIGINYGLLGNNLPPPSRTIEVFKSRGVKKIRIYTPDHGVLDALKGSGIEVFIGTLNQDLPSANVAPYVKDVKISGVVVGNEVALGEYSGNLAGALRGVDRALRAAGIRVSVTTTVSYGVMGVSYPPSQGSFKSESVGVMTEVAEFLSSKGYPLLANIYPMMARSQSDGKLLYTNILDAMVDALYSALDGIGTSNVSVIVSETGWPSSGGSYASISNAQEYNNNLVKLVGSGKGTPKRPSTEREAYIFAMYNENLKPTGIENHWGLYYPNLKEVYHVNL